MTLQQLACFCATAREGSFSGAARSLYMSQPSVAEQVRRLEAELDARLVISNGRGVTLTADGRTFLLHAARVLADAEQAAASVGAGPDPGARTLSLGLTRNAPYYPFWELAARALQAQPGIGLRLPGLNSSLIADAVRSGDLDAAVVILPVDPDGLEIRPLFRDEVLFVSADPTRLRRPARVEDLTTAPLILYDTSAGFGDPTRRQLAARAQQANVTLVPRFDVEHPETALQFAAEGWGDTVAARALTRNLSFPARLGSVSFAEPLYDSFAFITRADSSSMSVEALLEIVESWTSDLAERHDLHPG